MKNYFRPEEFFCKCGKCGQGFEKMNSSFILMLNEARDIAGIPWTLTSAYRCPAHNKAVGSTSDNHPLGKAVDIRCVNSVTRAKIIMALLKAGFRRIGLHQSFIHCDNRQGIPGQPDMAIWFYS